MPPTMMTRSASRPAAASRGRGTGGRAGRGGGRIRVRSGDQGNGRNDGQGGQVGGQGSELNDGVNGVPDFSTIIAQQLQNLLPTIIAQVGDHDRGQGSGKNQNDDAVNDNIQGDVSRGCTYKEFLAYNPKEYDGKGSTIVYTRWIEKIELVQDMSGYGDNQKVKYTDGSFLGKALTWWNSQIRTLGQEVAVVMLSDPYSAARSWSILSEDPYEEVARQLLEQVPHPSEYVPDPIELEDHVPVYIPKPENPEDLVPAKDEAPIEAYITEVASAPTPPLPPPSFLPTLIRPPHTRAAMAQRRATTPSTYHSLLPTGMPPLLPIPLPAPSTSRRADIPDADTPPQKRLLLTAPTPRFEVEESSAAAAARQPGSTMARRVDHRGPEEDQAAVRSEIEILMEERLAYKQGALRPSDLG
ncbi:hypothetical protein Tco_0616297 [Tanacetum coccineum]